MGWPWDMRDPQGKHSDRQLIDKDEPDELGDVNGWNHWCLLRGVCEGAARGGHLEVLQWARANGAPWDGWTCAKAAQGGTLSCCSGLALRVPL